MSATRPPSFEVSPDESRLLLLIGTPYRATEADWRPVRTEFEAYHLLPSRVESLDVFVEWLVVYRLLPTLVKWLEDGGVSLASRKCHLSGRVILEPVIDPHKHTFERSAILAHLLRTEEASCPLGGPPFKSEELRDNFYYHTNFLQTIAQLFKVRFGNDEPLARTLARAKDILLSRRDRLTEARLDELYRLQETGTLSDKEYECEADRVSTDFDLGLPTTPPPVDSQCIARAFAQDFFPTRFAEQFTKAFDSVAFDLASCALVTKAVALAIVPDEAFADAFGRKFAETFDSSARGRDRAVAKAAAQFALSPERALREAQAERARRDLLVATAGAPKLSADIAAALRTYHFGESPPLPSASTSRDVAIPDHLMHLGTDLTAKAKKGELKHAYGREKELAEIIDVLSRSGKAASILKGPAGSGKTAIVEELALRIAEGKIPSLMGKKIFSTSRTELEGGVKTTGDFGTRVNHLVTAGLSGDIILFIDEIHTMVGAGTHSASSIDFMDQIKTALTSGLKLIGATTPEDYKKHIESKGEAVSRRFTTIDVDIPDSDRAFTMLRGARPAYERRYTVRILEESLSDAIYLTNKYLPWKSPPDKSLDLLDIAVESHSKSLQEAELRILCSFPHAGISPEVAASDGLTGSSAAGGAAASGAGGSRPFS